MLKQGFAMAVWQPIFNGVGQGLSFLKDQLVDTVKDAVAHQQVMTQTAQAIKSTGDASGMTATQLEALAEKFGETTTFSADTTQAGENLLLTFTNIGKNVFPQATQAILDVSQAMHQDLQSSAIQVGKALDDPAKGMSALQRIGVTFSTSQQDAVKALMKTGDTAGAQKIILKELEKEFGGSAQAAGQTFGGQLSILSNNLEVTKEKIGTALLPVLGNLMNQYVIPLAQKFSDWMFKGGGLQDFQTIIKNIASFFTSTFLPALNQLLNQYIMPLALQMYDLFIKSGWVHDAFQTISNILGDLLPKVFTLATDLGNVIGWFQKSGPQGDILKTALLGIGGAILGLKTKDMINDFMNFANNTTKTVTKAINDIIGNDTSGLKGITSAAKDAEGDQGIGGIGPAVQTAEQDISKAAPSISADLLSAFAPLFAADVIAGTIWQKIAPKAPFPNAPTPLGPNGPVLPINPGGGNRGPGIGKAPGATLPGFASGGPVEQSGWYNFMEQGTEGVAYLPRGTQVIPNSQLGGGSSSGTAQPVVLTIDGIQFARLILPYLPQQLRSSVGMVGL